MRIFGIDGDAVTEMGLENTPDTGAPCRRRGAEGRARRLCQRQCAGDRPRRLRSSRTNFWPGRSISWSTFGSVRRANHPFTRALSPQSFCRPRLRADAASCKSPEALIERLDNGTCQGCHQAGSTAGFHFIGLDDKIDVAAEPHRGRRLAAFPRRAAAARRLSRGGRGGSRAAEIPAAVLRAAGRLETPTHPQYEPAGVAMPCMTPEDAARLRRQLGVRGGHGLHADRHRRRARA